MVDVLVAGAGPAGAVAALLLARAGARVVIVDREAFPRDKLCGDTLNPGAVRLAHSLGLDVATRPGAWPLAGMLVTGPRSSVRATYGRGLFGVALTRREFDAWLLDEAIRAGARFEPGLTVRAPLVVESGGRPHVRGLIVAAKGGEESWRLPATMTIAADGRRSVIAKALGLSRPSPRPRRWAFGVYASGVADTSDVGEMHIRAGWYLGIAPMSATVVNLCVVTGPRPEGRTAADVIRHAIATDADLEERCADATFLSDVRVLGPLAAETRGAGVAGALLAGDAAGFVDPMTGDGMHLAMQSAGLAAHATLEALETGDLAHAVARLEADRARAFGYKIRFNRLLRRMVDTPRAIDLAGWGANLAPALVRRAIRYAGDAA